MVVGESISLSGIVVSYNTRERTLRCVEAAREALDPLGGDVWVVDNASEDGTVEALRANQPEVPFLVNTENVGYGSACNQAMRRAPGRNFLLLNSDVLVTDTAICKLVERLESDPDLALVAPALVKEDGSAAISARRFPTPLREVLHRFRLYRILPRTVRSRFLLGSHSLLEHAVDPDWVTGACLLVRREAFEETGGFDESIFLYGEELDWCVRLQRAGWRVTVVPEAKVTHAGAASSRPALGDRRYSLALEGDLRYMARYRTRWTLRTFAWARTAGLAFEAMTAWLMRDEEGLRRSLYRLREHRALAGRYLESRESDD